MSEQNKGFMVSLDEWTEENVFRPLHDAWLPDSAEPLPVNAAVITLEEGVKKAIRAKVLESYRNGQSAGARKAIPAKRRAYGV